MFRNKIRIQGDEKLDRIVFLQFSSQFVANGIVGFRD